MEVLRRTMIRTCKADIHGRLLPACLKHVVRLPFHAHHQECYNTLIDVRRRLPPPFPVMCLQFAYACMCVVTVDGRHGNGMHACAVAARVSTRLGRGLARY